MIITTDQVAAVMDAFEVCLTPASGLAPNPHNIHLLLASFGWELKGSNMNPIRRLRHPLRGPAIVLDHIEEVAGPAEAAKVGDAIEQVRDAGVPWFQIVLAILPLIFGGGSIDIQALIAAILALLNPPA